jgi:hypothetical protein
MFEFTAIPNRHQPRSSCSLRFSFATLKISDMMNATLSFEEPIVLDPLISSLEAGKHRFDGCLGRINNHLHFPLNELAERYLPLSPEGSSARKVHFEQ